MSGKVVTLPELLRLRDAWRRLHRTVAWTNGCFDVLHVGHVRNLRAAGLRADLLVVGVNSDASVRRLKGPTRPVVPQNERAEMLAALECVDAVVIFNDDLPTATLAALKPDVHCKGADYAPPNGKPMPEAETVLAYGGAIHYIPLTPGHSTSDIIQRIKECNGQRLLSI